MITLRPFQADVERDIHAKWQAGARNVLAVLPTGAGKTVIFSHIVANHSGVTCIVAHRQELVCQISVALAKEGTVHRIIGPDSAVALCNRLHREETGRQWYDPYAKVAVAGIDTLRIRGDNLGAWLRQVDLWVMDEAHHIVQGNKWGLGIDMLPPTARGLGVTATPVRSDGKGLGSSSDGYMDAMVLGPSMRELITLGYLSDYRVFCPGSDVDLSDVTVSSSGDYSKPKLTRAIRRSHIVGDAVEHYLRIAPGRLGVTFVTDVQTAHDVADAYNRAGVPAEAVHAKTPDTERHAAIRRFQRRQILQLVNVDLFGEGFDLPAIEAISMCRPTKSESLYTQQFGRSLRVMEGKTHAIVIDHVNNIDPARGGHGLPDALKFWTLDRRERRRATTAQDGPPTRVCPSCTAYYEGVSRTCPFCGFTAKPVDRSKPEYVEGDLTELSPDALQAMRARVADVDRDKEDYRAYLYASGCPERSRLANVKRHVEKQTAQKALRDTIALWAGVQRYQGKDDRESYIRFYRAFGVDVLTAQALGRAEAEKLTIAVSNQILEATGG